MEQSLKLAALNKLFLKDGFKKVRRNELKRRNLSEFKFILNIYYQQIEGNPVSLEEYLSV